MKTFETLSNFEYLSVFQRQLQQISSSAERLIQLQLFVHYSTHEQQLEQKTNTHTQLNHVTEIFWNLLSANA